MIDSAHARLGGRLKMLVGKPGLDGNSNGAKQIAVAARESGIEVVCEDIPVARSRRPTRSTMPARTSSAPGPGRPSSGSAA